MPFNQPDDFLKNVLSRLPDGSVPPGAAGGDSPVNTWSKDSAMGPICRKMSLLEAAKYQPASAYQYQRITVDGKTVTYTRYNGSQASEEDNKAVYENALALRKLSIIAGVIYMLEQSPSYLTADPFERRRLRDELIKMADALHVNKADPTYETMENFLDRLRDAVRPYAKEIEGVEKDKGIIRCIRNAERYFVAEYRQSQMIVSSVDVDGQEYLQVDVPCGNQLSDELKQEYVRIHEQNKGDRPKWFNALNQWEQEWLISKVPADKDGDWTTFENLFQASSMQHLPGIKNVRWSYLVKKSGSDLGIISKSLKTATLVPYEMPKQEIERITKMNTDFVLGELAAENPELIYVNSLLSDVYLASILSRTPFYNDLDNALVDKQVQAVDGIRASVRMPVIAGNEPVNSWRHATPSTGVLAELFGRWEHVDELLEYYHKNYTGSNPLARQAVERLKELRERRDLPMPSRNIIAHKTAYASLLVEAMGGVVSTNCKSGKDRTGYDEIYRTAMRIYFEKYNKLSGYDDGVDERKKFIDIFEKIFEAKKSLEAAAANTPGSFGLKDTAKMLCGDIGDRIKHAYRTSNRISNLNKPPRFIADESAAMSEMKRHDEKVEKEIKRIRKRMPYLASLQAEIAMKVYSNKLPNYQKNIDRLTRVMADVIESWMMNATEEQQVELAKMRQRNEELIAEMRSRLQSKDPARAGRKLLYFSDGSEVISPDVGQSISDAVNAELTKYASMQGKPSSFSVSSAANAEALPFEVTEVTGNEFARKLTNTLGGQEYTTIQHFKPDGSCTSHLLFTSDDLSKLSKQDMIILAVRQVEDFQALSTGRAMRFSGDITDKNKEMFIKLMMNYASMMGYPYRSIHQLDITQDMQEKLKTTLDEMTITGMYSPSLFGYQRKVDAVNNSKLEDELPENKKKIGDLSKKT